MLGAEGELTTAGRGAAEDWDDTKFMKQPERKESDAAAGVMTLEELKDRKIWSAKGVDPGSRETHLSDEEFQSVFGMAKGEWAAVPKWKKDNLKKKHGLF